MNATAKSRATVLLLAIATSTLLVHPAATRAAAPFAGAAVRAISTPRLAHQLWRTSVRQAEPGADVRRAQALAHAGAHGAEPGAVTSVPDGAGGLYIAWDDFRDGASDIYALRVTNTGTVAAGWPADGLPVCTAAGTQTIGVALPDGSNGVLIGWADSRDDAASADGYVQRISSAGTPLWTANGVKVLAGVNVLGDIGVSGDGSGGIIAAWSAVGALDADIFAIRFTSAGALAAGWGASGTLVCSAVESQMAPIVAPDGGGGAIVSWEDLRDGSGNSHVWAQRMNGAAAPQWTPDGIQIDASLSGGAGLGTCSDGAGGAFIFWIQYPTTGAVYGQRVNGAGAAQWTAGGLDLSGATMPSSVAAVPDAGGAIVTWVHTGITSSEIRSQHVDAAGAVQWGASGSTILTFTSGSPELGDVVPDGAGGAYFVWDDDRSGFGSIDIYAQRVNASGAIQWAVNGIAASTATGDQSRSTAALDGAGGVLMAWVDNRTVDPEIYAQRFNSAGTAQLTADGKAVSTNPGVQVGSLTVPDDAGGAWVAWMEKRFGQYDIRARHLSSLGAGTGAGVAVCAAAGNQLLSGAIRDGSGGLILVWTDPRTGTEDIYAQRLDASGTPQWGAGGLAVCTAGGPQRNPSLISDNAGGAIIAWEDNRNCCGNSDIYAQRVTAAGSPQWGANGAAVCADGGFQVFPVLAPDGGGGAIVAWLDYRGFSFALYAQRMNAAGAPQWMADGLSIAFVGGLVTPKGAVTDEASGAIVLFDELIFDEFSGDPAGNLLAAQRVNGSGAAQWGSAGATICDVGSYLFSERMISDGASGAVVAWSDARGGPTDVYAQHLDASGTAQWGANGKIVCNSASWQTMGGLTLDSGGKTLLTWADERDGFMDIYAQRLDLSGDGEWGLNGAPVSTDVRGQYVPAIGEWTGTVPYRAFVSWTDNRAGDSRLIYAQALDTNGLSVWSPSGVVSTQLSLVSAEADAGRVRLTWYGPAGATATAYRRTAGSEWTVIGEVSADGSGIVTLEDRDVAAGVRYGYRLGVREETGEVFRGEVWIEVPVRLAFALEGLSPNPARTDLVVSLTLASPAPARLEMFDVSGRRWLARDLAGLGPGRHTLRVSNELPPSGVYVLRLSQAGRSVQARAVVAR